MVTQSEQGASTTDGGTPDIKEMVLDERKKGNVVFWALPGQLATMSLDDILQQPADGILYDLNRSEEVVLTFIDDPKWVNDFAVAQVIRKMKAELAKAIGERDQFERDAKRYQMLMSRINLGTLGRKGKRWFITADLEDGQGVLTLHDAIDAAMGK